MSGPPRVMWVGLRGFPGVQGGVETHAEQLCPRLRDLGCEVTVLTRRGYQPEAIGPEWQGVRFVNLWAPRHKQLEAVVHTFLGILYAGLVARPDLLHIQAIGPGLWTPWARLLGLRVVVTHHGPDYDRQKWGRLAKLVLRLGEASAARWANALIVISRAIQTDVTLRHGRRGSLILNGLTLPDGRPGASGLTPFGLAPGRYVLLVSRLVPEKRHHDLIDAFLRARPEGWKLAIVGDADPADAYARTVIEAAQQDDRVVLTGFQTGAALQALYAHAGLFVLPSSHEGLPIAILEALSWGLPVLASDIPANLEVGLPPDHHYPLGDIDALASRLAAFTARSEPSASREARRRWAAARFDWQRSARETAGVYAGVMARDRAWPETAFRPPEAVETAACTAPGPGPVRAGDAP